MALFTIQVSGGEVMAKITVFKCPEHGEQEMVDFKEPLAHCPYCGKVMEKVGEYDEGSKD